MSGDPNPEALRVLADVVQPPKGYERQQLRNFSDFTPLNRLDDAIPPESETARIFDGIATRIASGQAILGRLAASAGMARVLEGQ